MEYDVLPKDNNGYPVTYGLSVNMVKVSISLPNNTQITFESEEPEVLHEVVGMVLRDLPRDLMQSPGVIAAGGPEEKSTSVAASALSTETMTTETASPPVPQPAASQSVESVSPPPTTSSRGTVDTHDGNGPAAAAPPEFLSEVGREGFMAFCRDAKPLGDMRRVVVAAEGANRHFGVDGVNAEDLGWLFDVAGWRRPGNFTQTLRNAARSKFGWLERIPGRSGRYAATPLGLSKTLPSG